LIPLRDAIHFVVWLAGFFSNRIRWNGADYAIRNGQMMPLAEEAAADAKPTTPAPR
jgi:hypothetical protein